jgi:hypothetical protein
MQTEHFLGLLNIHMLNSLSILLGKQMENIGIPEKIIRRRLGGNQVLTLTKEMHITSACCCTLLKEPSLTLTFEPLKDGYIQHSKMHAKPWVSSVMIVSGPMQLLMHLIGLFPISFVSYLSQSLIFAMLQTRSIYLKNICVSWVRMLFST